jgi:hypothetical protein
MEMNMAIKSKAGQHRTDSWAKAEESVKALSDKIMNMDRIKEEKHEKKELRK